MPNTTCPSCQHEFEATEFLNGYLRCPLCGHQYLDLNANKEENEILDFYADCSHDWIFVDSDDMEEQYYRKTLK